MVNLFVICELDPWSRYLRTLFSICDCLFRAVNLTEYAHPDKYGYTGYGIGFDARSLFLLQDKKWGKNIVNFGENKSLSLHAENRKKYILFPDEELGNGLNNTTTMA